MKRFDVDTDLFRDDRVVADGRSKGLMRVGHSRATLAENA